MSVFLASNIDFGVLIQVFELLVKLPKFSQVLEADQPVLLYSMLQFDDKFLGTYIEEVVALTFILSSFPFLLSMVTVMILCESACMLSISDNVYFLFVA